MKKLLIILTILLFALPAWGATFTVCTSGCDETTIQAVFDNNDLAPGDVVEVWADTVGGSKAYLEEVTWGANDVGDAANTVTLQGRSGDTITICALDTFTGFAGPNGNGEYTKAGVTTQVYVVSRNDTLLAEGTAGTLGAAEWDWSGNILYLGFDPASYTIQVGQRNYCINTNGCDYLTIKNLNLEGSNGSSALYVTGTTNSIFDNLTISEARLVGVRLKTNSNNNTVKNCDISKVGETGIYLGTGSDTVNIYDNTIYDGANLVGDKEGIGIYQSSTVNIYGNDISGYERGLEVAGSAGDIDINIYRNKIHDNSVYGIQWTNANSGALYSNLIYNHTNSWGVRVWAYTANAITLDIYNNTFYNNGGAGFASSQITVRDADGGVHANTDIELKNNISLSPVDKHIFVDADIVTKVTIDYTSYYPEGVNLWAWGGTACSTLAAWRTASSQEAHGINTDPLPVDAANDDFHLQSGSPCINTGVDVGLTIDFDGDMIPCDTLFDIGMDEVPSTTTSYVLIDGQDEHYAGIAISGNCNLNNVTISRCPSGVMRVTANQVGYNIAIDDECYVASGKTFTMHNSAFQEVKATAQGDGTITDTSCQFSVADFGFRDKASGDFHLDSESVLKNEGKNTGVSYDLDSRPVPGSGGYSIGAYRYGKGGIIE